MIELIINIIDDEYKSSTTTGSCITRPSSDQSLSNALSLSNTTLVITFYITIKKIY